MAALLNAVKTAEGVVVNGFVVSPIIDKCEGCDRIREFEGENFCSSYASPASKWSWLFTASLASCLQRAT